LDWFEGDPAHLPAGLKVTVFAHDELILVVSPRHRWCGPTPVQPAVLAKGELLLREQGSGLREVIEQGLFTITFIFSHSLH